MVTTRWRFKRRDEEEKKKKKRKEGKKEGIWKREREG